jgi:DNA repair exonuclease SbcCD ATPase subunit
MTQAKADYDLALDLVEIFGPKGYRAVCFDGLIEKISDRAGQLLGVMTEGLYGTRLEQMGQDSKGNQKLILKPVIIKNASEVPLDDLSGGAEERVALAYDIAVAEAAGEGMPLLLDEVLSALDAVGKSEAMALLEEVSKTRPVLVIDHSSEFKAMFSQTIKVVYQQEESRLEFVT